jgi:adenylylsulfate kinase-like enzyme
MNLPRFSVGVSPELVARHLEGSPVMTVVGYQGSGKSTLAEVLHREMRRFGYRAEIQDASAWMLPQARSAAGQSRHESSIDAEIVAVLDRFEDAGGNAC